MSKILSDGSSGGVGTETSHPFRLFTGNTERLRVDASGNVGIGTTAPFRKLHVLGGQSAVSTSDFSSGVSGSILDMGQNTTGNTYSYISAVSNGGSVWNNLVLQQGGGNVGIGTTSPSTTFTVQGDAQFQRSGGVPLYIQTPGSDARITTNGFGKLVLSASGNLTDFNISTGGNVGIGTTTPGYKLDLYDTQAAQFIARYVNTGNSTTAHGLVISAGDNAIGGATLLQFLRNDGTGIGSIAQNGASSVAYNTTSDRRTKENIATTTLGLESLLALPVRDFSFISDPNHATQTGFIAQELAEVFPNAVSKNGDDGVSPLASSSLPWAVDYGRITPLLVKAIQDIATISGLFRDNLLAFLADPNNGIATLYATVINADRGNFANAVTTNQLCVGSRCMTPEQFNNVLDSLASQAPAPLVMQSSTSSVVGTATLALLGNNPAIVTLGSAFTDPGATFTTVSGTETILSTTTLDTMTAGTTTLVYWAQNPTNSQWFTVTRDVVIEQPALAPTPEAAPEPETEPEPIDEEVASSTPEAN